MSQTPLPPSKRPQPEPEIYPPGVGIPTDRSWASADTERTQRVYIARLGPGRLVVLALIAGVVLVVGFALLLGAALMALVVGVAVAVGTVVSAFLRGRFRRFS
ncbi:MAG TPA: hypothetical protein VND87_09855 [Stellaceae bacterium]|nr:hypothetical protein [Stellaceae bacterium]